MNNSVISVVDYCLAWLVVARALAVAGLITVFAIISAASAHASGEEFFLVPSGSTDNVLRYSDSGAFIDEFIASGSGGLVDPRAVILGPDGNIYVSQRQAGTSMTDPIRRYDGQTGAYIDDFALYPGVSPFGIAFGPDGHLYAANIPGNNVVRFDGSTGQFLKEFAVGGGLTGPRGLAFGPDGNLYVSSIRTGTPGSGKVIRYEGTTGKLIGDFATGVDARGLIFGPDGHLYVASFTDNRVLRFNGATGAPLGVFASGGGLSGPVGVGFGADGNLYVGSFNNHRILRYNGATGVFMDTFVTTGSGGLNQPRLFTTVVTPAANRTLNPNVELVANNESFAFNGIDESIDLGRSKIVDVAESDFTVHAWVNFTSLKNSAGPCYDPDCDISIVDKMASFSDPNDDGWRLIKQSDNRFWFCLGGGASGNGCDPSIDTTVISQTLAMPGVWYSVAAVKTSSTISIFVNGKLEGTSSYGTFADRNAARLLIGENYPQGAFLPGRVGQVELFGRALSNAQVRAIYARSKARYGK